MYSFQNEPGKSKLSEPGISFSVERSEKDKYTDTSVKENWCRVFAISGLILSSLNTLLVTFYEKTGLFACSKHCKTMEG